MDDDASSLLRDQSGCQRCQRHRLSGGGGAGLRDLAGGAERFDHVQFAGFTANLPGDDDGISTLGFRNEPTMDRVLASTSFLVDDATGALLNRTSSSTPRSAGRSPKTANARSGISRASRSTKSVTSVDLATRRSAKPS